MIFAYTNYSEYVSDIKKKEFKELKKLEKIEKHITEKQYLSTDDRRGTFLYRKWLLNSYRLMILEYKKNNNIIYVFYRVLIHKEYDELRKKIKNKKNTNEIINKKELEKIDKWYNEITKPKPKKYLPASLIELLNFNIDKEFLKEDFVYESKEWIDYVKRNVPNLKIFYNELFDFFNTQKIPKNSYVSAFNKNKYFLTPKNSQIPKKDFQRHSYRSYPTYLFSDEKLWFKIEQEDKSNLALSPEQVEIMENLKLPLFINGSAGSGKSTMLYYLFAEYIAKYLKKNNGSYPGLFVTYSKRLLNTSIEETEKILKNNVKFLENKIILEDVIGKIVDFKTFRELLIEIIDEKDKFTEQSYLSFSKFKNIFEHSYKKKDITPELAWHIIRTYIRGYEIDEMKVERYREIPEKSKTVLQNEFEKVYNKIWNTKWCKELFEQNWDEIKIIRELAYSKINKKYSFIFSDEAQDYTKMEIEFLLSLLPYEDFEIPKESIQLPVIFAGDPLQTLNPTGFRWERIKDIYNEKIKKIINRNISLYIKNLTYNYRNSKIINNFANRIQFIRKDYLDINEIEKPQEVWFANTDNTKFIGFVDNYIPQQGDDLKFLFIVGAKENVEKIPFEVVTTKDIKGQEFESVVIFNFFEQTLTEQWHKDAFEKMLTKTKLDTNELIFLEYLFNNLYVAITRAKENLYIVEQNTHFHKYWEQLDNIEPESETWKNSIAKLKKIPVAAMKAANPQQQAQSIFDEGLFNKNTNLLHLAAKIYNSIEQNSKADEAEALAFEFEAENSLENKAELYKKSADLFMKIGKKQKAFQNYWRAGSVEDILKFNDLKSKIEYKIANIIKDKKIQDIKDIDIIEVKKAWLNSISFKEKFYKLVEDKIKNIEDDEILIKLNSIVSGDKIKRLLVEQALNLKNSNVAKSILDELDNYDKVIEAKVMVAYYAAVPEKTLEYLYVLGKDTQIFELYNSKKYNEKNLDLIAYSAIRSNKFDYLIKILNEIDVNSKKANIISRFLEKENITQKEDFRISKQIFSLKYKEIIALFDDEKERNINKLSLFKLISDKEELKSLLDKPDYILEIDFHNSLEKFIKYSALDICTNNCAKINLLDKILFQLEPELFFKQLYIKDCINCIKHLSTPNNLIENLSNFNENDAEIVTNNIDLFNLYINRLKMLHIYIKKHNNNNLFKTKWIKVKEQHIKYLKKTNADKQKIFRAETELERNQSYWEQKKFNDKKINEKRMPSAQLLQELEKQIKKERQEKESAKQKEKQAMLKLAAKMKKYGESIEEIKNETGLSIEEIKKL